MTFEESAVQFPGDDMPSDQEYSLALSHFTYRKRNNLMIGRMWRGWTTRENSKAYKDIFKKIVLPEVKAVEGFKGAYLLRRDVNEETEFVVLTLFKSMKAVQGFAGENYELAVVSPEAKEVLKNFEERATHYEIDITPND